MASRASTKPITLILNAARINYDNKINLSRLSKLCSVYEHNVDYMSDANEIVHAVNNFCGEGKKPEIVITKEMEITKSVFQQFPSSVKLICEAGTGYNNLPIKDARERGVSVCNIPLYSTDGVAHMVITYMLNFSCSFVPQQQMLWAGDRSNFTGPFTLPLRELRGKTIGLIGGSGNIGTCVTNVSLALGLNVAISSRSGRLPAGHPHEGNPNVRMLPLDDLLRESDFVSVHCPLNDETRGSIDGEKIRLMKPTAFLINTARGAIINEKELIECMKENVIAGAGLDVQEVEPPASDSEIWNTPNIILTPHIGWRSIETRQRVMDMVADNIQAFIEGKPTNVVN
mmetsp:Transcript_29186/g.45352  ORF Transcript_29186/g.45352 Transcript_29186/m.45352 type:complete len:343 (-) Transcript_29186:216-1244(-)|eukprot:CAMPEP_0196803990 /NCGR_PEP_ID=MMETSP1362-20130617/3500_1 /TAXON_ID=163516 /ORGANISM="Leptocylindrus danicus, Strain CCMP1856" /LENGTH=342 /DNA_ID=CAMNT_0042175943 /DNA_START=119 /DNA_END=1147 /DNA_ORIENTATION=-